MEGKALLLPCLECTLRRWHTVFTSATYLVICKTFCLFSTSDIPRQAGVRTEEEGPVWSAPPFGILDRRTVIVIHGKTLINPDISETLIEKTLINGHPSIIQLIQKFCDSDWFTRARASKSPSHTSTLPSPSHIPHQSGSTLRATSFRPWYLLSSVSSRQNCPSDHLLNLH